MKAVIMAGGEGTRLRPLTEDLPKPLARLCGRPVLDYIFDLLEKNGVTDCVLALRCHAGEVRAHCERHPRPGLKVRYRVEETPLGTAGSVKFALLGEMPASDETVLVLSGDALCDFSLEEPLRFHREKNAAATILTSRVTDPREYGLVLSGEDGLVTGFAEKPSYTQIVGEYANTGIYLLSPQILERIPEKGPYDFAKDLFPALLAEKQRLYAFAPQGYWCDIGDLSAFRAAQADLLNGRAGCRWSAAPDEEGNRIADIRRPMGRYTLVPPVYIGKGVSIENGAVIGPGCVLDDGCAIGEGACITESVLLPRAHIGAHARLEQAVVCADGTLKEGAVLRAGSAVGQRAVVGVQAELCRGVCMDAGAWLKDGQTAFDHLDAQGGVARCFDDEGLRGEIGVELTPELAVRVGCALGSMAGNDGFGSRRTVGVASADRRACRVLADALAAGIQSAGARVLRFGATFESMFAFGMRCNALSLGVYVGGGTPDAIRIVCGGGLPAPRSMEREIEQRIARGKFTRAGSGGFGDCIDFSGIGVLYLTELLSMAPQGLAGISARASSDNPTAGRFLNDTLKQLGCDTRDEAGILLRVAADGAALTLSQGETRITPERAVAAYGRLLFQQNQDLGVENDFPRALDRFAAQFGRRVHRYLLCPADDSDSAGRTLAQVQCARDGLMIAVLLLADMRLRGITLRDLEQELPVFSVECDDLAMDRLSGEPAKILAKLHGKPMGEGILLEEEKGVVFLRPRKNGESLRVFAEASSWETAKELCADIGERVKRLLDNDGEKRYYG